MPKKRLPGRARPKAAATASGKKVSFLRAVSSKALEVLNRSQKAKGKGPLGGEDEHGAELEAWVPILVDPHVAVLHALGPIPRLRMRVVVPRRVDEGGHLPAVGANAHPLHWANVCARGRRWLKVGAHRTGEVQHVEEERLVAIAHRKGPRVGA